MKAAFTAAGAILLSVATPAFAHRVDEYLQATTISVAKDRVHAQIRLTTGIDAFPVVRALIDTDRDGVFSVTEREAYSQRVLLDLTVEVDGDRLPLRLVTSTFPSLEAMQDGRGTIEIDFEAAVPRGGSNRQLTFENRHLRQIAAYLVNGLVPSDPDIQMRGQSRNYEQSSYRLDYAQAGLAQGSPLDAVWPRMVMSVVAAVLLAMTAFVWRRHAPCRRTVPCREAAPRFIR